MKICALALAGAIAAGASAAAFASEPATTLVVFFDFNKARLTHEGERVIGRAAQAVQDDGYVQVTVTGHADTVGTEPYNFELSVRRAEAVRDELVRLGVHGRRISFEGKGTRNLLVRTGPGVREPQNRRVVIDLGS